MLELSIFFLQQSDQGPLLILEALVFIPQVFISVCLLHVKLRELSSLSLLSQKHWDCHILSLPLLANLMISQHPWLRGIYRGILDVVIRIRHNSLILLFVFILTLLPWFHHIPIYSFSTLTLSHLFENVILLLLSLWVKHVRTIVRDISWMQVHLVIAIRILLVCQGSDPGPRTLLLKWLSDDLLIPLKSMFLLLRMREWGLHWLARWKLPHTLLSHSLSIFNWLISERQFSICA